MHWLGWSTLSSSLRLAKKEGIKNRFTPGNRWISVATFGALDGTIAWRQLLEYAGDAPNFEELSKAFPNNERRTSKP